jgi:hypothetical protein
LQIKFDTSTITTTLALKQKQEEQISPYSMFKYSIRCELIRKYYERRLRRFFDFIQFEVGVKETEERFNDIAETGKNNT